jgi:hypothetical protein
LRTSSHKKEIEQRFGYTTTPVTFLVMRDGDAGQTK